ncbi:hypothetical protein KBC75_06040 [Candidatus Shapirobacteria bacterium]|nr:hypothetical protein [Candidatus Shapirobacteria bacterium]
MERIDEIVEIKWPCGGSEWVMITPEGRRVPYDTGHGVKKAKAPTVEELKRRRIVDKIMFSNSD